MTKYIFLLHKILLFWFNKKNPNIAILFLQCFFSRMLRIFFIDDKLILHNRSFCIFINHYLWHE